MVHHNGSSASLGRYLCVCECLHLNKHYEIFILQQIKLGSCSFICLMNFTKNTSICQPTKPNQHSLSPRVLLATGWWQNISSCPTITTTTTSHISQPNAITICSCKNYAKFTHDTLTLMEFYILYYYPVLAGYTGSRAHRYTLQLILLHFSHKHTHSISKYKALP